MCAVCICSSFFYLPWKADFTWGLSASTGMIIIMWYVLLSPVWWPPGQDVLWVSALGGCCRHRQSLYVSAPERCSCCTVGIWPFTRLVCDLCTSVFTLTLSSHHQNPVIYHHTRVDTGHNCLYPGGNSFGRELSFLCQGISCPFPPCPLSSIHISTMCWRGQHSACPGLAVGRAWLWWWVIETDACEGMGWVEWSLLWLLPRVLLPFETCDHYCGLWGPNFSAWIPVWHLLLSSALSCCPHPALAVPAAVAWTTCLQCQHCRPLQGHSQAYLTVSCAVRLPCHSPSGISGPPTAPRVVLFSFTS